MCWCFLCLELKYIRCKCRGFTDLHEISRPGMKEGLAYYFSDSFRKHRTQGSFPTLGLAGSLLVLQNGAHSEIVTNSLAPDFSSDVLESRCPFATALCLDDAVSPAIPSCMPFTNIVFAGPRQAGTCIRAVVCSIFCRRLIEPANSVLDDVKATRKASAYFESAFCSSEIDRPTTFVPQGPYI
jgi:hypothetical protein